MTLRRYPQPAGKTVNKRDEWRISNKSVINYIYRDQVQQYVKYIIDLREVIAELLSEALGLCRDHLSSMECMKSQALACLYYPKCPEPNKTLGSSKHSDMTFLTLLMQDSIGGLQILHQDQWVDVPPVRGALVANIGDLMQVGSRHKTPFSKLGKR